MNLTAIIVDDEIEGINTLAFMLKEYCPSISVIGQYDSSIEALKAIKRKKPNLLFLDIKMPHINGLELLELVGTDTHHAIFTTAYDEFVLQALRLNALDYLKKPISEEELVNAVAKFKKNGVKKNLQEQVTHAIDLVKNIEIGDKTMVGIKEGNKIKFVNLLDISHGNSDGNFTNIILEKESIYSSYSLGTLETILPESHFFRLHREYIINGLHIKEYDKSEGGFVVMRNGDIIPISRSRKDEFILFIKKILRNDQL